MTRTNGVLVNNKDTRVFQMLDGLVTRLSNDSPDRLASVENQLVVLLDDESNVIEPKSLKNLNDAKIASLVLDFPGSYFEIEKKGKAVRVPITDVSIGTVGDVYFKPLKKWAH